MRAGVASILSESSRSFSKAADFSAFAAAVWAPFENLALLEKPLRELRVKRTLPGIDLVFASASATFACSAAFGFLSVLCRLALCSLYSVCFFAGKLDAKA